MPAPTPIKDMRCQVVFNRECGNQLKLLRLELESGAFGCLPGQFVMLDLPETHFRFRRPFSVIDTPTPQTLDIYYKRVGTGTGLMWDFKAGQTLNVLGPLGNSFSPPENAETAIYIGGGIGIAPPFMMAKRQAKAGHCFYGVRSAAEIGLESALKELFEDKLHIATDDGSLGLHGNICHLLEQQTDLVLQAKEAYICGPTRMMEAAATLLQRLNPALRIEVSLEERMPCGTGACTGCVVARNDRYLPAKVCVEGPVFEARQINWQGELQPLEAFCEASPCQ